MESKDIEIIIKNYENGQSINSIARDFNTYPTSIRRLLERNNIELRHDSVPKGSLFVKDGEKLIEWAKAQGRPVTKAELANLLGKKRLSPSYFLKYPELGQYIKIREQKEVSDYSKKLYEWLQQNDIPYKPNDKTALHMPVTALLLGKYKGRVILQLDIKATCVSRKLHKETMEKKQLRAKETGICMLCINKKDIENLDALKDILYSLTK